MLIPLQEGETSCWHLQNIRWRGEWRHFEAGAFANGPLGQEESKVLRGLAEHMKRRNKQKNIGTHFSRAQVLREGGSWCDKKKLAFTMSSLRGWFYRRKSHARQGGARNEGARVEEGGSSHNPRALKTHHVRSAGVHAEPRARGTVRARMLWNGIRL